jgi:hypothetical protein
VVSLNNKELSLVDNIVKNTVKEELLEKYNGNTMLRSLVQIVPYGALVDVALVTSYNNILIERSKCFFDELVAGNIELTQEIIQSEDFLHSYFSTYKAALYTKQREKIRFLARLLKNGLTTNLLSKADEYDDYLKILDDLTNREITLLFILEKYQNKVNIDQGENALQRSSKFWGEFTNECCELLKIDSQELDSFLSRLQRTGCYYEFTGGFIGYSGGQGEVTKTFFNLRNLIDLKKGDLVYYGKL